MKTIKVKMQTYVLKQSQAEQFYTPAKLSFSGGYTVSSMSMIPSANKVFAL